MLSKDGVGVVPFRIEFAWTPVEESYDVPVDASAAFRDVYELLSRRDGPLVIVLGPRRIGLRCAPDLATFYPEGRRILAAARRMETVHLDFPEQGRS